MSDIVARPPSYWQNRPRPPAPEPLENPPGPIRAFRAMRASPIESFTQAHFQLPIVTTRAKFGTIACVSDPGAIRHVLVDNPTNYHKDPFQRVFLASGLADGLAGVEDERWRTQRRLLGPLFAPRAIAGFAEAAAAVACESVEKWRSRKDGQTLDVADEMARLSVEVLQRTIVADGLGRDPGDLTHAVWRLFNTIGRPDPLDLLGAPQWVPRVGRLRARPALKLLTQVAETIIEARRQRLAAAPGSAPNDLLTILLEAGDPKTQGGLTAAEIKANLLSFFVAGFESTANSVTWSLYLLSLDNEWRERLQAEVDRELPEGRYIDGSLQRLVATRATVEEAMRLYPPVVTIGRQAIGPDRLADQDIDPRTIVIIAPWIVHRHRLLWEQPDLFDPSRFLPPARDRIGRYAYLPFGVGPRTCIAMHFALQEIVIVLATLLRAFRFELAPRHRVWPVHRVSLLPRGGLPMILHRRG